MNIANCEKCERPLEPTENKYCPHCWSEEILNALPKVATVAAMLVFGMFIKSLISGHSDHRA